MPPKRRIAKLRRRMISAEEATELLDGMDLLSFDFLAGNNKVEGERARREAWEQNRDWLLQYWIGPLAPRGMDPDMSLHLINYVDTQGPGTRPWAWWRYDAPTSRLYQLSV